MRKVTPYVAVAGSLVLAACASTGPMGPSVMALPAKGKTMEQFQQDDMTCQGYAAQQVGYTAPGKAATESGIGTALAATAIGAVAGAALGSVSADAGAGAAIGAGAGLLFGSIIGSANANAAGGEVQRRYDMRYLQCMSAKGQSIPKVTEATPTVAEVPGYVVEPGYAYYAPPPTRVIVRSDPYWRYHHRHYSRW